MLKSIAFHYCPLFVRAHPTTEHMWFNLSVLSPDGLKAVRVPTSDAGPSVGAKKPWTPSAVPPGWAQKGQEYLQCGDGRGRCPDRSSTAAAIRPPHHQPPPSKRRRSGESKQAQQPAQPTQVPVEATRTSRVGPLEINTSLARRDWCRPSVDLSHLHARVAPRRPPHMVGSEPGSASPV